MEEVKKLEVEFENRMKDNYESIKEKEEKIRQITQNYENIKNQLDDIIKERNDIEETYNLFRGKLLIYYY